MDSLEPQCEKENVSLNRSDADDKVSGEKSRECPICHVYYKYGNSYWQHVRYVHASFLSQCIICEKCYKRTTMTKHHVLHTHKIAWHLCGNFVRKIRKSELQQLRRYSEDAIDNFKQEPIKIIKRKILHLIRSFNCYDCDESFTSINELFKHVNIHRGEHNVSDVEENTEETKPEEQS